MTTVQFHSVVDKLLSRCLGNLPPDQQPCCQRCTNPHCCSEPAYCDKSELEHMLQGLTSEQLAELTERTWAWLAVFAASDTSGEELISAFKYRLLNLPCPFLKDGRCTVYERRPLACREFFALGKPEDCAMPARQTQKFASYPKPSALDIALTHYYKAEIERSGQIEMDHIGAHLVRILLNKPTFTTASHHIIEMKQP